MSSVSMGLAPGQRPNPTASLNYVAGAQTVQEAKVMCDTAAKILIEAGMHLREWTTRSRELLRVADETSMHPDIHFEPTNARKVLGVIWNPETDTLHFEVFSLILFILSAKWTKRLVLKHPCHKLPGCKRIRIPTKPWHRCKRPYNS